MADHISSHTMRRTAITTMLRLGMPEQLARKISGHAAHNKKFFRCMNLPRLMAAWKLAINGETVFKIEALR